jgi:hypothetical protein
MGKEEGFRFTVPDVSQFKNVAKCAVHSKNESYAECSGVIGTPPRAQRGDGLYKENCLGGMAPG